MDDAVKIKLPVFEGPLDLLLHLIKGNKVDIYDIPINTITQQYLEYLEMMKELDLEIAGDFLVMAATLIHIKSRMLLPIEETADTDEPEDPRLELVMKLIEYKSFKDAALELQERADEWAEVIPRMPLVQEDEDEDEVDLSLFDLNLFDLLSAFNKMLEKAPPEVRTITKETLTVKDKMNMIIETLKANAAVNFESLFKGDLTLSHFLVTFVALLELTKLGITRIYQKQDFSTIWIINPEAEIDYDSFRNDTGKAPRIKGAAKKKTSGIIKGIVERTREEYRRAEAAEIKASTIIIKTPPRSIIELPPSRRGLPSGIGRTKPALFYLAPLIPTS